VTSLVRKALRVLNRRRHIRRRLEQIRQENRASGNRTFAVKV
jgi:hypothetical protein